MHFWLLYVVALGLIMPDISHKSIPTRSELKYSRLALVKTLKHHRNHNKLVLIHIIAEL